MKLPSLLRALGLAALLTPTVASADAYTDAFERSAAEEKAGHWDAALAILHGAEAQYPEDYAIALQIGWVAFRAERWDVAEAAYARAIQLSHGAFDARLGLAWTRAKKGDCAHADFASLQNERPDDARVRDGLAACEAPKAPLYTAWGSGSYLALKTTSGYGGAVGAIVTPGPWLFAAAYRGTYFSGSNGRFATEATTQHEGYGTVGYGSARAGVSAHYGYLGGWTTAHHMGATGRFSPWGDVLLAYSTSFWDDLTIHRLELSWRMPLGKGVSLRPAGAAQLVDGAFKGAGALTLLGDHGGFGWWLGAKGGSETRPVQFTQSIVWNYVDTITAGATAGLRVSFGGASAFLGYDLALTRRSEGQQGRGLSLNHLFTLGLAYAGGRS